MVKSVHIYIYIYMYIYIYIYIHYIDIYFTIVILTIDEWLVWAVGGS